MPGFKRSTSVMSNLDKKMKQEQQQLPTSPASTVELGDSPVIFDLEPPAYSTPIKQQQQQQDINHEALKFHDGIKRYNGYVCKFLKKPVKLQLFSAAMSVTYNSGVAVFSMPRLMRARLIQKVDKILETGAPDPAAVWKNPFRRSPVFLTLGHHARLFRQLNTGETAEPFPMQELKRGMYFHGRLAIDVLGVKSSNTVNELSLMLRVKEMYMMANQVTRATDDDENMGTCTLEEPLECEDGSEDDGVDY